MLLVRPLVPHITKNWVQEQACLASSIGLVKGPPHQHDWEYGNWHVKYSYASIVDQDKTH